MHRLLMRRKAELENQLVRARGTDFSGARTDVVSIGSRVRVTDLGTGHGEAFAILGAWDSEPEKGTISYLSPVAQSLLNCKPGQEVEFELDGTRRHYRIEAVEAVAPAAPSPAAEPTAAPAAAPAGVEAGVTSPAPP
jgi:transcription elongation GreA/GreB family factor